MKKNKLSAILFEIAAFFWFMIAFAGKDWMFLPIGLCFVALGIVFARDKEGEKRVDSDDLWPWRSI